MKCAFDDDVILALFTFQAGAGGDTAKLAKELADAQAEAKKSKQEADRLLQIVKTSQEEQSMKEKLIKELQE